jgi:predicted TIM-barrel fold metal-dependent hydrolase
MGLAPAETHWPIEHFQKYSLDDFEKDVFVDGHVDMAVLQSTYLKEWYTNGFNSIEQNAEAARRFNGKVILNGRWDPREGQAGLEQLEADHAQYGIKGVKLYTAEWREGSRGWKLSDPEAVPFLDKCVELGIKNIHVHKGPTIWPLDKDGFDVTDIDHVATDYNGKLNFIVEHCGIPRIEDFCYIATQEPNVYAGISVVVGAHMHARPKFFAKLMGELLFWVGEDKITFGSDYAIWEPKWQVEGFVDWEMPDDDAFSDYPRLGVEGKKKILGLNAAKLYGIEVPEELRLPVPAEEPASPESAVGVPG